MVYFIKYTWQRVDLDPLIRYGRLEDPWSTFLSGIGIAGLNWRFYFFFFNLLIYLNFSGRYFILEINGRDLLMVIYLLTWWVELLCWPGMLKENIGRLEFWEVYWSGWKPQVSNFILSILLHMFYMLYDMLFSYDVFVLFHP